MGCGHGRGDWIEEKSFFLCAGCWARLPEWPVKYGVPTASDEKGTGPQYIIWSAAKAEAANGFTLNDFLKAMARRFMQRTRPPMTKDAAYDAAIGVMEISLDKFGDPSLEWTAESATEMADDEMQYWDHAEGNN